MKQVFQFGSVLIQMNAKQLSEVAGGIGRGLKAKDRFLMRWRPRICPFHVLAEHVPLESSVLDIGCGTGLWLLLLARLGKIRSGVGAEVNSDRVDLANSLREPDDGLQFVHIEPGGEWPDGEFDCATMIDVLHHVPCEGQKDFIMQIGRTGAKRIIFKDIDPASRFKSFMNTVHDMVLSRQRPVYCRRESICKWFEEMGYRVEVSTRCDMLWYSHYLIVAEKVR